MDRIEKGVSIALLWQRHRHKLLVLVLWIILLGLYVWYMQRSGLSLQASLIKGRNSLYAPLLYILLFVLRPLIFFPASLLCIAGGLLFGVAGGIFYTTIGANLSAMTAYLVGRYLGRDLLDNDDSTNLAQRYARRLRANSFDTVLVMRLLLLPYDFVNYLSGFLRIDGKAFFLATLIGTIPATISLVLIGVAGDLEELAAGKISLNPWALAASVVLLASSLAISRYLRRQDPQSEAVRQR